MMKQLPIISPLLTSSPGVSGSYIQKNAVDKYPLILNYCIIYYNVPRRLNDTFGKCGRPKVGWQIDPFGHSREMASIFAHLGYDGIFLGRIDYQDKEHRFRTKTAEMIWKGSFNLGNMFINSG